MDEYRKHLEQAREARNRIIPSSEPQSNNGGNRIEEMLRNRPDARPVQAMRVEPLRTTPQVARTVQAEERTTRKEVVEKPKKKTKWNYRKISLLVFALVFIAALIYGLFIAGRHFFPNAHIFGAKEMSSSEVIQAVEKLVGSPQDEDPTVATVTDLEPLKNEAFFANAKVGDKLLVFSKSKKAILFRPSENRIIAVGPLNN